MPWAWGMAEAGAQEKPNKLESQERLAQHCWSDVFVKVAMTPGRQYT